MIGRKKMEDDIEYPKKTYCDINPIFGYLAIILTIIILITEERPIPIETNIILLNIILYILWGLYGYTNNLQPSLISAIILGSFFIYLLINKWRYNQ
jgi:hypothetical protein